MWGRFVGIMLLLQLCCTLKAQNESIDEPIDINTADKTQLEKSGLFSDFQIASLIEYRCDFGTILSLSELALVDGFSIEIVEELSTLIYLSDGKIKGYFKDSPGKAQLILKSKYPGYYYGRYSAGYKNKIFVGGILESDYGEKFPDFVSFNGGVENIKMIKNSTLMLERLVIGDYSLRMGQGLVLWNSFPLSFISSPASIRKNESKITPYTSSDEDNFFRGAGATFSLKEKLYFTSFFSYKPDKEKTTGWNLSYGGNSYKIGMTGNISLYPEQFSIFGVDFDCIIKKVRLFGEGAYSSDKRTAALLGIIITPDSPISFSLLLRYYDKDFRSFHSNGYRQLSSKKQEAGVTTSLQWKLASNITVSFWGDYEAIQKRSKCWAQLDFKKEPMHLLSFKFSNNSRFNEGESLFRARSGYAFSHESGISLSARIEGSLFLNNGKHSFGGMIFEEVGYNSLSRKWDVSVRFSQYHIDNWSNRIYCYEKDLPRSFSMNTLYGRGVDVALYLHSRPMRWLNIYLKCSHKKINGQISLTF